MNSFIFEHKLIAQYEHDANFSFILGMLMFGLTGVLAVIGIIFNCVWFVAPALITLTVAIACMRERAVALDMIRMIRWRMM